MQFLHIYVLHASFGESEKLKQMKSQIDQPFDCKINDNN